MIKETDTVIILPLTKSFRCSTEIANAVEVFGKENLDPEFSFQGIDNPIDDGLTAYITSTNAGIIRKINELHNENQGYILTRPIKDIFACPLALVTAASGKQVYHKQYRFLEKEYKNYKRSGKPGYYQYLLKNVADEEIHNAIKLLLAFKTQSINIFDVMSKAKTIKKDKKVTVGTGFSLKGMGYTTVYIENDLNRAVAKVLETGCNDQNDLTTLRLFYVACTRARKNLYNAKHLELY